VGECAQHRGQVYGLVAPLWEQTHILAERLTGRNPNASYRGSKVSTKLKVMGVELAVMGIKDAAHENDEVVNYVENHDNQTLFDINVYKLPLTTSPDDRARAQILAAAVTAFSQGVAYYHAGVDTLRSKSMDRNSYNSGDWFNRLDWTYMDNNFGVGAPSKGDNGDNYGIIKPLLANAAIKPTSAEIKWTRDAFRDLLALRASTKLFHLRTADEIKQRLKFYNTGSAQEATVVVGHLDGTGGYDPSYKDVLYFINVDKVAHTLTIAAEKDKAYVLHPVHRAAGAADRRPVEAASYAAGTGAFTIPPRTALVYVNP